MNINSWPQQHIGFGMSSSAAKKVVNYTLKTSVVTHPGKAAQMAGQSIGNVAKKALYPVASATAIVLDHTVNQALETTVPPTIGTLARGLNACSEVTGAVFIKAPIALMGVITEGAERVVRKIIYGKV